LHNGYYTSYYNNSQVEIFYKVEKGIFYTM